jgi:hypothetical protein
VQLFLRDYKPSAVRLSVRPVPFAGTTQPVPVRHIARPAAETSPGPLRPVRVPTAPPVTQPVDDSRTLPVTTVCRSEQVRQQPEQPIHPHSRVDESASPVPIRDVKQPPILPMST